MLSRIKKYICNILINRAKKEGLQIHDTARVMGKPNFGSEPYLISIGKNVLISTNVTFLTHDGGISVLNKLNRKYKDITKFGRIVIEENCFIGHSSIIMPGVTIGKNSIIGAGAIVTKDIEEGSVVVGVPAKRIMSIEEYGNKCLEYNLLNDLEGLRGKEKILKKYPYHIFE